MNPNFQMSEAEVQDLVGLDMEQARARVEAKGGIFRVSVEDGVSYPITADLRDDRVDVSVEKGKVTAAGIS